VLQNWLLDCITCHMRIVWRLRNCTSQYIADIVEMWLKCTSTCAKCILLRKAAICTKIRDYKLLNGHHHSQLRLQLFSIQLACLSNCLPEEVVSAPSLNAFKGSWASTGTVRNFHWIHRHFHHDDQRAAKTSSWPKLKGQRRT